MVVFERGSLGGANHSLMGIALLWTNLGFTQATRYEEGLKPYDSGLSTLPQRADHVGCVFGGKRVVDQAAENQGILMRLEPLATRLSHLGIVGGV